MVVCTHSKAIDEYLAMAYYWTQHELPVVDRRGSFNTVGPRQIGNYGMVLPRFVQAAAIAGQTPPRVWRRAAVAVLL